MEKRRLREQAKKMLEQMSETEKREIEQRIAVHLFSCPWWKKNHTIGITVSMPHEWDTEQIIRQGWKDGKKIAVPRCEPATFNLQFRQLQDFSQLECVYQNLWEPITSQTENIEKNQIDLMIVPGLLFDEKGFRIGYGGGYYDRYLADFSKETIAVTSSRQIMPALPIGDYDLPVDHIITEKGILF